MPNRDEIRTAYAEGEKAVVAVFQRTLDELAARVMALEDPLVTNSRNIESAIYLALSLRASVRGSELWQKNSDRRSKV